MLVYCSGFLDRHYLPIISSFNQQGDELNLSKGRKQISSSNKNHFRPVSGRRRPWQAKGVTGQKTTILDKQGSASKNDPNEKNGLREQVKLGCLGYSFKSL